MKKKPVRGMPGGEEKGLRKVKAVAVALLLLAMTCVALALWAGNRQTAVQGPWGLAVLRAGQVWLSVDEELWRLDAEGRRLQTVSAHEAGLPGAAGTLMAHPQGHLVAWARHSPTLHLLAADTGRPVGRLSPQWPDDLARHADEAINFAFAPDGRVAIATGGGHAVAMFDGQGRFLARTAPDTYRFTHGLWWADGAWWTTDTNRAALVRLDDATLKETSRVALVEQQRDWRFLGLAAATPGVARGDGAAVLGTLARLANDMETGHVVDVAADGRQRAYPVPDEQSSVTPRALAWNGSNLLMVDGQSFAVRRYARDHRRLADWGDATVRADLTQRLERVQFARNIYRAALGGAVVLFLLGLGAAAQAQRMERRVKLARLVPELGGDAHWQPGIAGARPLGRRQLAALRLRSVWPLLLAMLAGVWGPMLAARLMKTVGIRADVVLMVMVVLLLGLLVVIALLACRVLYRVQTQAGLEPLANDRALRLLSRPDLFWPLRRRGEQARETVVLGGTRWLVLTNQRLLVFHVNALDACLRLAVPRGALRAASLVPLRQAPAWGLRWLSAVAPGVGYLSIEVKGGKPIAGMAGSAQAASRLVALIDRAPAARVSLARGGEPAFDRRRARLQVLASLLIPGAGQWMQRRSRMALLLFVCWLFLAGSFAVTAWIAWGPSKEVAPALLWQQGIMALLPALVAAADAWRLRGSPD